MEEIEELIRRYKLEEDLEHVIISYHAKNGSNKRCFLLKRRYMRVAYGEDHHVDYPLTEVIEATVRFPELLLSEALYLLHKEMGTRRIEDNAENVSSDEETDV